MILKRIFFILLLFTFITASSQDAKKYTTYIVKSGETLKSIAKKVGCKYKVIKNLNPDVNKRHPKENTTLVIPNKNYGKLVIRDLKPVKKVLYHTVLVGNTFFGIAKKYNVPISSIKEANPQSINGLTPGMRLRIPSQEEITVKKTNGKLKLYKIKKGDTKWNVAQKYSISVLELERKNPKIKNEFNIGDNIWIPNLEEEKDTIDIVNDKPLFIYHVVKPGEGLFRIAVTYGTTQEKIIEYNPEATKKLRAGMLLKIPAKKKDKFIIHEVIKGDTFFSLTRKYDVTQTELLTLNPELSEGVKEGMLLKIKPLLETERIVANKLIDSISENKYLNLSFLLPILADKDTFNSTNNDKLRDICTDFYMGAEIAIDSLRKQGLSINYHIYDTKNDLSEIYQLINNENVKNADLIIGPFFIENAKRVASGLPDIPIFTPSNKKTYNTSSNLIKVSSNSENNINALVSYLTNSYKNQKIILIHDSNKKNINEAKRLEKLLVENDSINNVTIIQPSQNKKRPEEIYMEKKALQESIDPKKENWVLLISDDKIISSDVVNTYGVLALTKKIKLFTTKEFDSYDYLDYQLLGKLSWSFPSSQFTQLHYENVQLFNKKYFQLNFTQPSKYSYTGFDMTYDALVRMSGFETYKEALEAGVSVRLSRQFDYNNNDNGFDNKGVLLVNFTKELEFQLIEK